MYVPCFSYLSFFLLLTNYLLTIFLVGYSEKDIQNIQGIGKNAQYQEMDGIITSPNTFSRKLDI